MFLGPLKAFISTASFQWMSKVNSTAIKGNYLSMKERKGSGNACLTGILERGAPLMQPLILT